MALSEEDLRKIGDLLDLHTKRIGARMDSMVAELDSMVVQLDNMVVQSDRMVVQLDNMVVQSDSMVARCGSLQLSFEMVSSRARLNEALRTFDFIKHTNEMASGRPWPGESMHPHRQIKTYSSSGPTYR